MTFTIKPRGNIGKLPYALREQINRKLRDNRETYRKVAEWLLGMPIEPEGLPVSTVYQDAADPVHCCEVALQRWYCGPHYARWEKQANLRDDLQRRLHNIETRFESLGDEGKDRYVMSVVLEVMEKIALGEADAKDVFMLSTAYSKLRGLKKGDAQVLALQKKLQAIADETSKARENKGNLTDADRQAVLDRVDEIMGVRK